MTFFERLKDAIYETRFCLVFTVGFCSGALVFGELMLYGVRVLNLPLN
jgi:hypothetical protein